jgi:hypothetical protein
MAGCREKCGRPVVFVTMTATGKLMAVDPVPDEGGNVYARTVRHRGLTRLEGHVRAAGEPLPDGWTTYMPHVRTCTVVVHLNRYETGARGAPGPKTQPALFDLTSQTPSSPEPGQQEGTTP